MARKLLTIKYDGTEYCGWQVQPNGVSVQSTVQVALIKLTRDSAVTVTGCSRTDAGVHAEMFCLHFDYCGNIPDERFPLALNPLLPPDVKAVELRTVPDSFHARYSCRGKTYIYKISNSKIFDPFKYKYYLSVSKHIDEKLLSEAAACFKGEHDFKGFCSAGSSVADTVRTVYDCGVERVGDDVYISITADGFLYNMVRIIVGTLLDVADGRINVSELPDIIASCDRTRAGNTAKAHGLFLQKVYYDFDDLENCNGD